jgi:hypothetical protein
VHLIYKRILLNKQFNDDIRAHGLGVVSCTWSAFIATLSNKLSDFRFALHIAL